MSIDSRLCFAIIDTISRNCRIPGNRFRARGARCNGRRTELNSSQIVNAIGTGGGTRHVTTLKRAGFIVDNRSPIVLRVAKNLLPGLALRLWLCTLY